MPSFLVFIFFFVTAFYHATIGASTVKKHNVLITVLLQTGFKTLLTSLFVTVYIG